MHYYYFRHVTRKTFTFVVSSFTTRKQGPGAHFPYDTDHIRPTYLITNPPEPLAISFDSCTGTPKRLKVMWASSAFQCLQAWPSIASCMRSSNYSFNILYKYEVLVTITSDKPVPCHNISLKYITLRRPYVRGPYYVITLISVVVIRIYTFFLDTGKRWQPSGPFARVGPFAPVGSRLNESWIIFRSPAHHSDTL